MNTMGTMCFRYPLAIKVKRSFIKYPYNFHNNCRNIASSYHRRQHHRHRQHSRKIDAHKLCLIFTQSHQPANNSKRNIFLAQVLMNIIVRPLNKKRTFFFCVCQTKQLSPVSISDCALNEKRMKDLFL